MCSPSRTVIVAEMKSSICQRPWRNGSERRQARNCEKWPEGGPDFVTLERWRCSNQGFGAGARRRVKNSVALDIETGARHEGSQDLTPVPKSFLKLSLQSDGAPKIRNLALACTWKSKALALSIEPGARPDERQSPASNFHHEAMVLPKLSSQSDDAPQTSTFPAEHYFVTQHFKCNSKVFESIF